MENNGIFFVIAGRGKLAKAIQDVLEKEDYDWLSFTKDLVGDNMGQNTIAVHCGSGRELPDLLAWCEKHQVALVQASTGQTLPAEVKTAVITTPNLIGAIVKFIVALGWITALYPNAQIRIVESHQKEKKSVPGTAREIATAMNVPTEEIVSVREEKKQLAMGVPEEHLDGHAYHFITIEVDGMTIRLQTEVNGREPYGYGLIELGKKILELNLAPGHYKTGDIFKQC